MVNIDPRLYFLMRKMNTVQKQKFRGTKIRILDIGHADGSFMGIVRDNMPGVISVDGVDVPSRWTQKTPLKMPGKCYAQDLQVNTGEIPLSNYHIIVAWEVIEHIENVPIFLRNVRKLLVNGGVFLLSTPNLMGLSRFVKGKKWVGITETDHKYLFDSLSLCMILERNGFCNVNSKGYFLPSAGCRFDWLNEMLSIVPGGGMLFCVATPKE